MLERKGNVRDNGIHIRVGDILYGIMKHRVLIMALTAAGLMIGMVLSGISYLRGGDEQGIPDYQLVFREYPDKFRTVYLGIRFSQLQ